MMSFDDIFLLMIVIYVILRLGAYADFYLYHIQ